MAGGAGVPVSPGAGKPSGVGRRGHRQRAAWLPLDIIISEIAARSDPATLVRCAATCRDARRRVAEIADDPDLRGRLRLRGTDRFVLPLLRGHLIGITTYSGGEKTDLYMVDTAAAAAAATRVVKVKTTFAHEDRETTMTTPVRKRDVVPLDSRGGLVLVRVTTMAAQDYTQQQELLVCNLAARRRHALPPEPAFPRINYYTDGAWSMGPHYVLLVGNSDSAGDDAGAGTSAAVGRHFQVLKANLVMSEYRSYRRLLLHTYSSEHGAWSPCVDIPTPNLQATATGRSSSVLHSRPLVFGGEAVHWLCLTDVRSYMLILQVAAARVNLTELPASFPRDGKNRNRNLVYDDRVRYLLATATAGGNPVVLVADKDRIEAWEQSKHTKKWKTRPQVVIENQTVLAFEDGGLAELVEKRRSWGKRVPEMLWFGESSGAVLLRVHGCCLLWLDLQSKKIVRCFSSDSRMQSARVYCPYEVDLSSWVPTFSSNSVVTTV